MSEEPEVEEMLERDARAVEEDRKNGEPIPGDKWRATRPSEHGRTIEIVSVDRANGRLMVKGKNFAGKEAKPYGMSIRILKERFERVVPPVEPPTPLAAPGV